MNTTDYLKERKQWVDQALDAALPAANVRPSMLHEAMRYCVFNGGKRIRPILCMAAAEALGRDSLDAMLPAIALELFHCSTLTHDDLPCMDDDDLRRGKPTCHKQFGAANAILTGDALMILAFEQLAETGNAFQLMELAKAAGSRGVIAGQVEDLAAENQVPSAELIEFIHLNKTAALIQAATRMGARAGDATDAELEALSIYGQKIGLSFQIIDDILDETADDSTLGKPVGSDRECGKMTYPNVFGMQNARNMVDRLTAEAVEQLGGLKGKTEPLHSLATYLIERSY